MALTFFWRCEGTTLDGTHDFTAGSDTTATAAGAPAIDAAAALVGSNGILVDLNNDHYDFDAETTVLNRLVGSCAFWFRIQTWNGNSNFVYFRGSSFLYTIQIKPLGSSGTGNLRLRINEDDAPNISTLDLAGNQIALNTTYFCTFSWDQAANTRRLRLYDSSGTLLDSTTDTSTAYTAPADLVQGNGMKFGDSFNVSAVAYYLDNIFIGNAYADADTFLTNRSITSYTSYGTGGVQPNVNDTATITESVTMRMDLKNMAANDTATVVEAVTMHMPIHLRMQKLS